MQLNAAKTEVMCSVRLVDACMFPPYRSVSVPTTLLPSAPFETSAFIWTLMRPWRHVSRTAASCFGILRQLRSVQMSLPRHAVVSPVTNFVLTKLDYCNSLLVGLPAKLLNRLQAVINTAARLVCHAWRQITLHLCCKTYTGYESRKGSSTSYASLRSSVNIVWHHPTCPTNFNKSLEWSPDSVCRDHRVRQRSSYQLYIGDRAFLVAAVTTWNSLSSTVTAASTLYSFRRALKTHLFTASFLPS